MAEERVLTINLRKELIERPSWKRKMSAARVLKEILYKHTRTRNIKIDSALNKSLLQGKKKIKIKLVKTEEGFKAELA
jgi:ribosomal protein L31E